MNPQKVILALATLFFLLSPIIITCATSDDDDSPNGETDDDGTNDDDQVDDDTQPPADDDTTDDDTGGNDAPQPYTPCCKTDEIVPLPFADPGTPAAAEGPFGFYATERTFIDVEREREIEADIIFPSSDGETPAASAQPYPVVLVVHGFSSFRATVREYGERLATWGYLAVVPQLPYLTPFALDEISHLESAKDLLFLLNTLCCDAQDPESFYYDMIDRSRLAAVGHSLGGKLSILASLLDGGLVAVVGLDPVDGSGPVDFGENNPDFPDIAPELAPDLLIPTLYLGGSESGIEVFGQACAPVEENYHEFWTHSPPPSVEVTFLGADHTDFIPPFPFDICNVGTADHTIVKTLAKEYAIAFLNAYLRRWDRFQGDFAGAGIEADEAAGYVTWQAK